MPVVICISMVLVGIVLGLLIGRDLVKTPIIGKLKVDITDPDGPYLFLEFNEYVDAIQKHEYVTLKVDMSNYISQD